VGYDAKDEGGSVKEEVREQIDAIIFDLEMNTTKWKTRDEAVNAILALPPIATALEMAEDLGKLERVCQECGGVGDIVTVYDPKLFDRIVMGHGRVEEGYTCPTCHGAGVVPAGKVDVVKLVEALTFVEEAAGQYWSCPAELSNRADEALQGLRLKTAQKECGK
jgi:hypothetical protein